MKEWLKKIVEGYSHFVSTKPFIMLIAVIVITILAINFAGNVKTTAMDNRDSLPDDVEVIQAYNIMQDSFGSSDQLMIAIISDPEFAGSGEIRDLRSPSVLQYMSMITDAALNLEDVVNGRSPATLLADDNNGILPKTIRESIKLSQDNVFMDQYMSKDASLALIKLDLSDNYDDAEVVSDIQAILDQFPSPAGVRAQVAGEVATGPVMEEQLGPDMAKTSQFSLFGIIIVLLLLFRSLRYGLTPLGVIGIGILWAFGYLGLRGMNLNSATSGVISMIMGIGIDFGIQIVTRFRFELDEHHGNYEQAMKVTMDNVFVPMATTTLAALIGFKAMAMGELTVMEEFGQIMSYGITACFFAAITVVPSILVLTERLKQRKQTKKQAPEKQVKQELEAPKKKRRKMKSLGKIVHDTFTMIGGMMQ